MKFLKTNDAANYLGVSRSSLTNWVKQGLLGGGATPGGHYRFTVDELNIFAEKRGLIIPNRKDPDETSRILIIDDDEGFREFAKEALSDFTGYELREANDGMQGALTIGTWRPDLIILDLRMPNMNGIEFLRLIKSDPKTVDMNIIVASAHLSDDVREELEHFGVDFVLEKPVRLAKLIAAVEKLTTLQII